MGGGEEGGEEEEEEGEGGEHDFGDVDNKYALGRESIDQSLVVVMIVLRSSSLRRDGGGGRGICKVCIYLVEIYWLFGVDRRDSVSGYWIMDTLWESLQGSIHGRRAELGGIVRVEIFFLFSLPFAAIVLVSWRERWVYHHHHHQLGSSA